MRHLIELCAGTGAVSLAALGCSRFPVSRIGSKAGWVEPILEALDVLAPIPTATMVEADPRLASLLRTLLTATGRDALALSIESSLAEPSRTVWERARGGAEPVDTLLWMAGARGGIGGYKGTHKLRPSVDGFIPTRASLARRLRRFDTAGLASVICADASTLDPHAFAASAVFIDPPYVGRQGYRFALVEPVEALAVRWSGAGHRVVVSEAHPLSGASESREITALRRGQSRRSLTTNPAEWLSIYAPSRKAT